MSVLRVTESFAAFTQGFPEVYNTGRLINSDDPVVKGRESHFEPVEVAASRAAGIETATAAPAEKRTRTAPRVPRKRAAKKTAAKPPAAKKTAPAKPAKAETKSAEPAPEVPSTPVDDKG